MLSYISSDVFSIDIYEQMEYRWTSPSTAALMPNHWDPVMSHWRLVVATGPLCSSRTLSTLAVPRRAWESVMRTTSPLRQPTSIRVETALDLWPAMLERSGLSPAADAARASGAHGPVGSDRDDTPENGSSNRTSFLAAVGSVGARGDGRAKQVS